MTTFKSTGQTDGTNKMSTTNLFRAVIICVLACGTAAAQLAGTYFINPAAPAGGGNYTTLAAAVADLTAQGVSGPVIFEVFDDNGPFTESSPFTTVNVGWAPNNAVMVMGAWTGVSATNRVTFRAALGESPVFDATGQAMGIFWNGANYVTIEGIEIHGAIFDAINLYNESGISATGPLDPIIRKCRIHDCGSSGVVLYGNVPGPQNTIIENNFFWNLQTNNSGGFATNARFGYISSRRSTGTVVQHNTFYVSTGTGSEFAVMGSLRGTGLPWASVRNNLIVKPSGVAPTRPIYNWREAGSIPTLEDFNVYDDTSGGPFARDAGVVVADLAAFQVSYAPREASARAGGAFLVNPAMGDLHILLPSAAVGAATPTSVTTDIDGETRPGGCATDAGADEVQETGPLAAFTATPTSGPAPLTVNFTDTSFSCSGGITTWSWDLNGDGLPDSSAQNPTWVYSCPGNYTVTLIVNDPMGAAMTSSPNFIQVGAFVFSLSTTGAGDLTVNPVPSTCPQTMGSVAGWTVITLDTTPGTVGQGPIFGIRPDAATFLGLSTPPSAGNPLHFIVNGTTYPDAGPLTFPAGTFSGLVGATMDALMIFRGPTGNLVYWTSPAQVTF